MPNITEQLEKQPYSDYYAVRDRDDAMLFLYECMRAIVTGKVPLERVRLFAANSMQGAISIARNASTDEEGG